jgi:hypothetical protein
VGLQCGVFNSGGEWELAEEVQTHYGEGEMNGISERKRAPAH